MSIPTQQVARVGVRESLAWAMSHPQGAARVHEAVAQRRVRIGAEREHLPHPRVVEAAGVVEQSAYPQRRLRLPRIFDRYLREVSRHRRVEVDATQRDQPQHTRGDQRLRDRADLHAVVRRTSAAGAKHHSGRQRRSSCPRAFRAPRSPRRGLPRQERLDRRRERVAPLLRARKSRRTNVAANGPQSAAASQGDSLRPAITSIQRWFSAIGHAELSVPWPERDMKIDIGKIA